MPLTRHLLLPCLLCLACLAGGCLFSSSTAEPQVEDVQPGQRQITSPPAPNDQPAQRVKERAL